jgi:hypothetical protein
LRGKGGNQMRARVPLVIAATAVSAIALVTPFIVADADETPDKARAMAHRLGLQTAAKDVGAAERATNALVTEKGANPYMALKPGSPNADLAYWKEVMNLQGQQRAGEQGEGINVPEDESSSNDINVGDEVILEEQEPVGQRDANDSLETAEPIGDFNTQANDILEAELIGDLATPNAPEKVGPFEENNELGAASDLGGFGSGEGVETDGDIGGDGAGDFYLVSDVEAGEVLTAITNTPESELDTVAVLFDTAGNPVSAADDQGANTDTRLSAVAPKDGDFIFGIFGFNEQTSGLPADVNDASTAVEGGSSGAYIATFGRDREDADFFSVDMQEGDVLGASLSGQGTQMAVFDDENRQLIGSTIDLSAILPGESPLPGGGNAVLSHVAPKTGTFTVMVTGGAGEYSNEMVLSRPGAELFGGVQKIFLDFDGAEVDTGEFGVEGGSNRELSGLNAFLGRWDLDADEENALIQQITDTVTENLEEAAEANGTQVEVLTSLQDGEQFGQADVSRVVIGGTVEESGIETIGIAQSNDTGNFATEETAMVLLDILSGDENDPNSLNFYLNDESDRVEFIGSRIGDVASHEAGHFLGSFHNDQFNDVESLMDAGGNPEQFFGPGNDGIGGTADDEDASFAEDVYSPAEGFSGIEDTQANTGFAFSADAAAAQAEEADAAEDQGAEAEDQGAGGQGEEAEEAEQGQEQEEGSGEAAQDEEQSKSRKMNW